MDGISEREVERELNDKDDPFVGLDDIEQNSIQTLWDDLAFLKERLGNHVDPNITLDEYRKISLILPPYISPHKHTHPKYITQLASQI